MKQINFLTYILLVGMVLVTYSCDKESKGGDDEDLPANLAGVKALLKEGGLLKGDTEYYNYSNTLDDDTTNTSMIADLEGASRECYTITKTTNYSVNTNPDEFVLMNPWSSVIWPGSMIQGGSLKGDNTPASIPIEKKRNPITVFLSIVSGNNDMDSWYRECAPTGAATTQAMNEIMADYLGSTTPAYTSFKIEAVHSIEEMASKLDLNFDLWKQNLNSSFGYNWSKEKNYVAVYLRQAFFTMTCNDLNFRYTFTDDITANDLDLYTGPGNPLCYVSSVTYGRTFVMLYESSASTDSLSSSLAITLKGNKNEASYDQKKVVNESKCTMIQIGGNPVEGLQAVFGDFDALSNFITNGAKVSADNVGAPLSFTIKNLYDNTIAKMSNTLEYSVDEKIYTPVKPENSVEINIFNASMKNPTAADDDYKVSNHSYFKINSIKVGHSKDGTFMTDGGSSTKIVKHTKEKLSFKTGKEVPIYETKFLQYVPKDHKIRIECEIFVYNQAYHYGSVNASNTYNLIRIFEFNENKNAWEPIESDLKNDHRTFKTLWLNTTAAKTNINFDLNFRFKCDGYTYPL